MAVEYLNGSISILDTSNARGPPVKNILLKTTLWYRHWRDVCIITYWSTAASRCDHQLPATGNCWRRPPPSTEANNICLHLVHSVNAVSNLPQTS